MMNYVRRIETPILNALTWTLLTAAYVAILHMSGNETSGLFVVPVALASISLAQSWVAVFHRKESAA